MTMQSADVLIEIGTEELPPQALLALMTAFAGGIVAQLDRHEIKHGTAQPYATPRRLAVCIAQVAMTQPARQIQRRGPAIAAAFDVNGAPTPAAIGFATSCGVKVTELETVETDKGRWLVHQATIAGQPVAALLPEMIEQVLRGLPIPKRMRWGAGTAEFVRPIHWVTALVGDQLVAGSVLDVPIGNVTYGHRFHAPAAVTITAPNDYAALLRQRYVEPDFAHRREYIRQQITALAATVHGQAIYPAALLDEITALCEWPVALLGHFDAAFLAVPREVLIETMQKNQKYIPLFALAETGAPELLPHFIAIANIASHHPDVVRAGNERVIRPRFTDAQFFWEQDRKTPLAARVPQLNQVVFQEQLGSLGERAQRIAHAMTAIAPPLELTPALCERAALLAKADLVTHMVGEFGNLQGIMGRYYALNDGEDAAVAAAIEEHYLPRAAGDQLPTTAIGQALAITDRLDTLIGAFAIGQRPTGVKDPYGLRRSAIAVMRILIETPLPLDLLALLNTTAAQFPPALAATTVVTDVFNYFTERLTGYYTEHGISADCVEAVLALQPTVPTAIDARIRAVAHFRTLPAADALAAASKRINNILKKAPALTTASIDSTCLIEPAEQVLAARIDQLAQQLPPLLAAGDYVAAFHVLADVREPVDQFFDAVMVMADDPALQRNRCALLSALQQQFVTVADISRLQPVVN